MTLFVTHRFNQKQILRTKTGQRSENSHDVVLQLPHSIADIEDSEISQSQSSLEMYSPNIEETQDEMSIVGRIIQLTKDYTTGNATFKQKEVEGQLLRQSHVRMEN